MLDLKVNLPSILKDNALWTDLMDVATDVLTQLQTEIELKNRNLEIGLYTSVTELVDIARSLGYSTNLEIKSDLTYVKKEVESIVYKIKNKAIYAYYNYIFKLIPYAGKTFILYKDAVGLHRAIDFATTYIALATHDHTTPFVGTEPILHYDEYIEDGVYLDDSPLYYLDASTMWYLDQDLSITPTNHLAIEYALEDLLIDDDGLEYIMIPKYFNYLEKAVKYGRKATDIPHVGVHINCIVDETPYYDTFQSATSDYSVADIKLITAPTNFYFSSLDPVTPVTTDVEDLFYKLKVGTGTKALPSKNETGVITDVNLHCSFENPSSADVLSDLSNNSNVITIEGTSVQIAGVSGKTTSLNGINATILVDDYTSSYADTEIDFWFKGDSLGQLTTQPRLIYQDGFLNCYYDVATTTLSVTLIGSLLSETLSYTPTTIDNKTFFVSILLDRSNDKFYLYIDTVLQDFADISAIGTWSSTNDLYVGSSGSGNYFKGYVDELRIYGKLLTIAEREYLYSNQLGSTGALANEVYSKILSPNQINEGTDYTTVDGIAPANSVNETLDEGDGVTNSFSGTLSYNNLTEGQFDITYTYNLAEKTAHDDKQGNIVGDAVVGTINYTTGAYAFVTTKTADIVQEIVYAGSKLLLAQGLANTNITESSFSITYFISDTQYTAVDDGLGNISGTGISTGIITYSNGYIDITFSGATDADNTIYATYEYSQTETPDDASDIDATYKVSTALEITEAGIADVDGNVVLYATFPPVKFSNIYNHLALQFFIEK